MSCIKFRVCFIKKYWSAYLQPSLKSSSHGITYPQPLILGPHIDPLRRFPFFVEVDPQRRVIWPRLNPYTSKEFRLKVCSEHFIQYLQTQ